MSKPLYGTVPIIPTPFTEDETIDEGALRNLIDFAIASGLQAVCLPAYASEFYKLTDEERLLVVKIAVEQAAGRVQVVAQSNHPSLKVTIQLATANVAGGADVISLAVPRLFGLPETSIKAYLSGFFNAIPETQLILILGKKDDVQSNLILFILKLKRQRTLLLKRGLSFHPPTSRSAYLTP